MARGVDAIIDEAIAESANPLPGASEDYEPLFRLIGSARLVLLGEATHGTHEVQHDAPEAYPTGL
jgi:erythromycin esterase-like protein